MRPLPPLYLLCFFGMFELYVTLTRRSRELERDIADKGSLQLIWQVAGTCSLLTALATQWLPDLRWPVPEWFHHLSVGIFLIGMAWRWHSILYLGKYFTVDVSVVPRQPVIDTGPYRWIRHPAYLGGLLMFIGAGLTFAHPISVVLMIGPPIAVFLHRIRIEEALLVQKLGAPYEVYMKRTKRLVPFVY